MIDGFSRNLNRPPDEEVSVMSNFPFEGYIDYPGVGIITDSQVYEVVKIHSRFIDRINPKKMTEMSLIAQCVLMGIYKNINPKDSTWSFYGKNSLLENKDWG